MKKHWECQLYYYNMEVKDIVRYNADRTILLEVWCNECHKLIQVNAKPEDIMIYKLFETEG